MLSDPKLVLYREVRRKPGLTKAPDFDLGLSAYKLGLLG